MYLFPNNFLRALLHVFLPFYIIIQIKNIKNDYCRKRALIAKRRRETRAINASAAIDGRRDIDLWYPRPRSAAEDKFQSYHKATSNRRDYPSDSSYTPLCTLQYIHIYRVSTQAAKQNSRGRSRAHFVIC